MRSGMLPWLSLAACASGEMAQTTRTPVTKLRFVAANASGGRRRQLARAALDGTRLQGNLHTLGYFSADVCIGTPPKTFDLIVDTGSSLTALPCRECTDCGEHVHAHGIKNRRYDISQSTTGEQLTCSSSDCPGHRCVNQNQCAYSVSYTEGSSIRGHMMYDLFNFSSVEGTTLARAAFGCQTYESGLFKSQVADGITGLSRSSSFGGTLFDWLSARSGAY